MLGNYSKRTYGLFLHPLFCTAINSAEITCFKCRKTLPATEEGGSRRCTDRHYIVIL